LRLAEVIPLLAGQRACVLGGSLLLRADAGVVSIAAALTRRAMQQTCIRIFMFDLLLDCSRPIPD
jgi:hypothetical protein